MSLNYISIGKRIQKIRKQKKMSQATLAEIIDKSTSFISYIETAKKSPSLETLVDVANALEVSADELLTTNLKCSHEPKIEFGEILKDCTAYERRIITETAKGLKQTLRDERYYHSKFVR